MSQHTPGPMVVRGLSGEPILCCDACLSWRAIDGTYITRLCSLHAAAPDLLAALEEFCDLSRPIHPADPELDAALGRCEERARVAIRKATAGSDRAPAPERSEAS